MADDAPEWDDIPDWDKLPDEAPPLAQGAQAAAPSWDDIPDWDALPGDAPQAEGVLGTAGREAAHSVVPAATGVLAGGALGALGGSVAGPVGAFVGGIGGMIAGSISGDYVQDKALKAAGVDDDVQRAVNKKANPASSFIGGVAPFIGSPVVGVERGAATLANQFTGNALKTRAAGGAMMGAFEGGHQLYEGEFHPGEIAANAAFGAVMPSGNRATRALHGAGEGAVKPYLPGRPDTQARPGADVEKADAAVSESPDVAGGNANAQQPAADPKAPNPADQVAGSKVKAEGGENAAKKKYTPDEVFGDTGLKGFSTGDAHTDPTMQAAIGKKPQATLAPESDLPPQVQGKDLGFPEPPAAPAPPPVDPRIEQAKQFNEAVKQEFAGKRIPADVKARFDENVRLLRGEAPTPVEQPKPEPEPSATVEAELPVAKTPRATLKPEANETPVHDDTALIAKMRKQGMDKLADRFEATPAKGRDLMRQHILANLPRDRTAEKAGLKNKIGQEANTKEQLGKQNSAIDAIQKAHDEHLPGVDETAPQLMERLKAAVDTAHTAHGSNPLGKKSGYLPRSAPDTFKWYKLVQDAAQRKEAFWTPDKVAAFHAEEAALRSGTKGERPFVDPKTLDNSIEANRRTGDAVVEAKLNREAHNPEDDLIAAIDAKRSSKTAEEALNKIETEEQETAYATPKKTPIATLTDIKAIEDPAINLAAPLKEKATTKEKKSKYAFEPKTKSGKELDPETAARYIKMAEEAQTKSRIRQETKPTYVEGDKYSPLKTGTKDLLGSIVSDERGGVGVKALDEAFDKLFAKFAKSGEKYGPELPHYIAKRLTTDAQKAGRSVGDMLNETSKTDNVIKVHALAGKAQAHTLADKPAEQRAMYDALEKQNSDALDPHLRNVFEDTIVPAHFETIMIRDWIRKNHPEVDIGRDTEDMVHRRATNGGKVEMELDSIGDNTDPTAGSSPISTTKSSPVMERQFVALEDAGGNRHIIHLKLSPNGKPSGEFSVWKKYESREADGAPPIDPKFKVNDIYEAGKRRFKMKDATIEEIEANALGNDGKPMQYQRDAAASVYTANAYHRQLLNHLQTLDRIKASPEFERFATLSNNEGMAKGWKQSETPGFEKYWMDEHMRETLEDAYQQGFTDSSLNKVRNFSRAMTQSIFWTPVAHIMNVEVHWAVGRGWKWLPTIDNYRGLAETGTQAIKSVVTHDKIQDILHEHGAGLIYGGTRGENSTQRLALALGDTIKRDPTGWGKIADKMNMTAGELIRGVYKASRHGMWSVNDMFLTQAILERLRTNGKNAETASPVEIREAINHIEQHIPNYRTPSRIMSADEGGRTIAKYMRDPLFFGFGRYRYAVFNSFANMTNSVLHGSKAERIETAGQMMVMGAIALAVYPLIYKPIAQMITGNKEAEVRGRGPIGPAMHVKHDLFGHGDIVPLVKETISVSPLFASFVEAVQGKNFAGKDILNKKDVSDAQRLDPKAMYNVGKQGLGWALGQRYSPVSTLNSSLNNPNQGVAGGVRDAVLDLKNPSPKAQKYDAQTARRLNQDTNRRAKSPPSILEKLLP